MNRRHLVFSTCLLALSLAACSKKSLTSSGYNGELWSENGVAFLGATLLESEGMVTAHSRDDRDSATVLQCPVSSQCIDPSETGGPGPTLELNLVDCQYASTNRKGLWYSIHRIAFPSQALCEQARAEGFSANLVQSLVGQTPLTRTYGRGPWGDQTHNWRLAPNGWAVLVYTDYPSGLTDPAIGKQVQGGATVTFDANGNRTVKFLGAHVQGFTSTGSGFLQSDGTVNWTGIYSGSPAAQIQFDESLSTTAGDIVVTGTGATKRVTSYNVYTQHNIVKAVGQSTLLNGAPLTWSAADCCWPTSGAILTNFTRDPGGPNWASETLTFGPNCGSATYTVYGTADAQGSGVSSAVQLNHCE